LKWSATPSLISAGPLLAAPGAGGLAGAEIAGPKVWADASSDANGERAISRSTLFRAIPAREVWSVFMVQLTEVALNIEDLPGSA
jgi:hypothetical protein